jgi:hypothetical protein
MPQVRFPEQLHLKNLLTDLIGKDVSFAVDVVAPSPTDVAGYLTMFVGDDDAPLMLAAGDIRFAHLAGAALALIPKGRAEDAIAAGDADPDLIENYREVMNVITRAVNDTGGAHVRLIPGSSVDVASLGEPVDASGLEADVDGYGRGHLYFWRLAA